MITKNIVGQKPKEIIKDKTQDGLRNQIKNLGTDYDARCVLPKAVNETKSLEQGGAYDSKTFLYKAMTLFEFDNGVLMFHSVPDRFRVFVLEFSKNLQKEFNCLNPSEQSIAEVTALNFVRILEIQRNITVLFGRTNMTRFEAQYVATLSKELDRAQRHYLTSLQTLKMLKSPAFEVNIKTQTAVVGQNQVVQSNNK